MLAIPQVSTVPQYYPSDMSYSSNSKRYDANSRDFASTSGGLPSSPPIPLTPNTKSGNNPFGPRIKRAFQRPRLGSASRSSRPDPDEFAATRAAILKGNGDESAIDLGEGASSQGNMVDRRQQQPLVPDVVNTRTSHSSDDRPSRRPKLQLHPSSLFHGASHSSPSAITITKKPPSPLPPPLPPKKPDGLRAPPPQSMGPEGRGAPKKPLRNKPLAHIAGLSVPEGRSEGNFSSGSSGNVHYGSTMSVTPSTRPTADNTADPRGSNPTPRSTQSPTPPTYQFPRPLPPIPPPTISPTRPATASPSVNFLEPGRPGPPYSKTLPLQESTDLQTNSPPPPPTDSTTTRQLGTKSKYHRRSISLGNISGLLTTAGSSITPLGKSTPLLKTGRYTESISSTSVAVSTPSPTPGHFTLASRERDDSSAEGHYFSTDEFGRNGLGNGHAQARTMPIKGHLRGKIAAWTAVSSGNTTPLAVTAGARLRDASPEPSSSSYGRRRVESNPAFGRSPPRHPSTNTLGMGSTGHVPMQGSRAGLPSALGAAGVAAGGMALKGWNRMERLWAGGPGGNGRPGSAAGQYPSSDKDKRLHGHSSSDPSTALRNVARGGAPLVGPTLPKPLRDPIEPRGGLLFGRPLRHAVEDTAIDLSREAKPWLDAKGKQRGENCPALIVRCIQYLEKWGIEEEGIFRITGRSSHVARLRADFDAGVDYDLCEADPGDLDPHAVSSVFKAYIRELPEPILTLSLGSRFDDVLSVGDEPGLGGASFGAPSSQPMTVTPTLIAELASLVASLPKENLSLLRDLCMLLRTTADHYQTTKMPLSNLLLVFCPSLSMSATLLRTLVQSQDEIFSAPKPVATAAASAGLVVKVNPGGRPYIRPLPTLPATPSQQTVTVVPNPLINDLIEDHKPRVPPRLIIPMPEAASPATSLRRGDSESSTSSTPHGKSHLRRPSRSHSHSGSKAGSTDHSDDPESPRSRTPTSKLSLQFARRASGIFSKPRPVSSYTVHDSSSTESDDLDDSYEEVPLPVISLHIPGGGSGKFLNSSPSTSNRLSWSEARIAQNLSSSSIIQHTPIADRFRAGTSVPIGSARTSSHSSLLLGSNNNTPKAFSSREIRRTSKSSQLTTGGDDWATSVLIAAHIEADEKPPRGRVKETLARFETKLS